MNIDEKLTYFNLNPSYTEEELESAYEKKLRELQANYELLKRNLKPENTKEFQETWQEKYKEIVWNIISSENIDEEKAKMLFALLLDIKKKINEKELDSDLLIYLNNLKYDGSMEDLKLLYDISNNQIPTDQTTRK